MEAMTGLGTNSSSFMPPASGVKMQSGAAMIPPKWLRMSWRKTISSAPSLVSSPELTRPR